MSDNSHILYGGDYDEPLNSFPSLGGLFYKNFKSGGNKKALINGENNETWTYNDLLVQSTKVAKALHAAGIRQNDVVSIISENRLEYAAIAYGTIFLKAITAPTNFTYTERELEHTLSITKPKFVFVSSNTQSVLEHLKKLNNIQMIIILTKDNIDKGKIISYENFIKKYSSNDVDIERLVSTPIKLHEQTAAIFMSSGTTGLPKGVQLSHGNLIALIASTLEKVPLAKQIFGEIISLYITPWFHVMGFMGKIMYTGSGDFTQIFVSKFSPKSFLKCIEKYKAITIAVPPPVLIFLSKTPLLKNYDLSNLKVIFVGAAPVTKELEEQVIKRFNDEVIIYQAYGQTESTLSVIQRDAECTKPASVGKLVKGCYGKIIDENGNNLGPNKTGELCIKGPYVMKGYMDNPEATAQTIDHDGWLHTGDIAYYDEDKDFFIVDRLKELIKYKAYQVAPAELEGLLISHPDIRDAGVIGIPDESAGELPFAFIVKKKGSKLTEKEVQDFVAKNMSNPKWLRGGVKFIDEIPKNISGKILRREMRELYKSMKAKL